MTAPASTSAGVTWAGVFERIFVKTDTGGNVSGTPQQLTYVSATGQGRQKSGLFHRHRLGSTTATVNVPMSSSHLHRRSRGKKPKVVNGVAQVKLKVKGSTVERLKSDYERPLPVTVKVTYKLNGKPIAANDIEHKGGTVEVDYQLTNDTAKPVQVCFKGFNGAFVQKTVTEPAPIYAYFYVTLPKNVTKFSAPGAFLNADISGVEPQWLVALFEPLGPTTQTLKLTMDTRKAKIPKAKLILEFVEPEALAGSTPAQSAAAVQKARANAERATAKVQADVAALELKAGSPHTSRASSPKGASRRGRSKTEATSGLSFGTSTRSLARMHSQVGVLEAANRALITDVRAPTRSLDTDTRRSMNDLSGSTRRSIDGLSASATRSLDQLTASTQRVIENAARSTRRSVDELAAELRRTIQTPSLNAITARAARLQQMATAVGVAAGKLAPEASGIAGPMHDLVASLPTPAAHAVELNALFGQLSSDLAAFGPAVTATAQFRKLHADVAAGQALAKTVGDALGQIQNQARAVDDGLQTLQSDATSLQAAIGALVTAAAAGAKDPAPRLVASAARRLESRFARDIATARSGMAGAERSAQQQLTAARRSADAEAASARAAAQQEVAAATSRADHAVAAALQRDLQSVAAAEQKVNGIMASVRTTARADLKAAEAKAKQGGQAALASVQASAAQAEAAAKNALTKANDDYAELLGLNQQAVAWELPGGDATGVTEQEGSLIYTISGS